MNRTDEDKALIRLWITERLKETGLVSTTEMAVYLEDKYNYRVSQNTVSAIYKELGYVVHRQPMFVWRHNEGHE